MQPVKELLVKYGITPKGVLHVGAQEPDAVVVRCGMEGDFRHLARVEARAGEGDRFLDGMLERHDN